MHSELRNLLVEPDNLPLEEDSASSDELIYVRGS
jgi:hypothetical protein